TSGSSIANEFDSSSESVTPSVYVVSLLLIEQGGTFAMQPLADSEYIRYALVEGKDIGLFEIIALFKKSFESYRSLQAQRMASYCGNLMAIEYFTMEISVCKNIGQSWSCKLEINGTDQNHYALRFTGVHAQSDDSNAQKLQVQRNLQIEGRTAVTIAQKFMLPFRRDPLMLKKSTDFDSDQLVSLALNETSILVITAKNLSEVPLRLMSMSIEVDDDEIGRSCTVGQGVGILDGLSSRAR
ncbi:hypothetical protein GIB67_001672, partial [Kingdonia uniflora]